MTSIERLVGKPADCQKKKTAICGTSMKLATNVGETFKSDLR